MGIALSGGGWNAPRKVADPCACPVRCRRGEAIPNVIRNGIEIHGDQGAVSTVCRLSTERGRWRVKVETWGDVEGWRGRLLFEPEWPAAADVREGPAILRGPTREDLVSSAYEIPERRLKELLNSLG
jgi:hypothetical protein